MQATLTKLGPHPQSYSGSISRIPDIGGHVTLEFTNQTHEYVTTPIKRIIKLVGSNIFLLETANSRYRLSVR